MRAEVFLLQAPDGTLYAVDEPECGADGCEPGTDSSNGGSGADNDDDDDGGTEPDDDLPGETEDSAALPGAEDGDDGCGCRSDSGPAGPALLLLSMLGLWRRRESAR